jgi:hypothetical protein
MLGCRNLAPSSVLLSKPHRSLPQFMAASVATVSQARSILVCGSLAIAVSPGCSGLTTSAKEARSVPKFRLCTIRSLLQYIVQSPAQRYEPRESLPRARKFLHVVGRIHASNGCHQFLSHAASRQPGFCALDECVKSFRLDYPVWIELSAKEAIMLLTVYGALNLKLDNFVRNLG